MEIDDKQILADALAIERGTVRMLAGQVNELRAQNEALRREIYRLRQQADIRTTLNRPN